MTDLRAYPRISAPATTATVVARLGETSVFSIRDLSRGGARLVGDLRLAEGERVHVILELDHHPIRLNAEVIRVDRQRSEVAVAFRGASEVTSELIGRSVDAMLDAVRAATGPTVLVVHSSAEVSSALERDLVRLGLGARLGARPLEAIWQLEDEGVPYCGAILGGDLDPRTRADLLAHIEERHPDLRRVLVFGDRVESMEHACSARVHAVLRTPWQLRGLARSLGLGATSSTS